MATLAKRLITADEFLDMEFDSEHRFELDNGVVRMMAGGLAIHSRIQTNVIVALSTKLRGTGCSPYGPDFAVRTHGLSIRYPDVAVYCGKDGPENDRLKAFDDPKLVVEVLSDGTRREDIKVKLPEYRAIASLDAILYLDPVGEEMHLELRDPIRQWIVITPERHELLDLPIAGGISLSWSDIFARG